MKHPRLRSELRINQEDPSSYELEDPVSEASLQLDGVGYLVAEQFEEGKHSIESAVAALRERYGLTLSREQIQLFLTKADRLGFLEVPLCELGIDPLEPGGPTNEFTPNARVAVEETLARLEKEIHGPFSFMRQVNPKIWLVSSIVLLLGVLPWPFRVKGAVEINSKQVAVVRSPIDGRLDKVLVSEGDVVQAGEALAQMSGLQEAQPKAVLIAPIAGVVITEDLSKIVGKVFRSGDPVLDMSDVTNLDFTIYVDEKDLAHVRQGAAVEFKVQAFPGDIFRGQIRRIAPVADLTGHRGASLTFRRQFRVYADLKEAEPALLPGMSGTAQIQVGWSVIGYLLFRDAVRHLRVRFVV